MSRIRKVRISKRAFYDMGGFSNPNLFRRDRGRGWEYYRVVDWYLR